MPCGPTCACLDETGVECLAVVAPEAFGYFRDWCASGDPLKRRHVLHRSRLGLTTTLAEPDPQPTPPRPLPDIPLAGDVVEAIAHRIGADRLAKWWERKTGLPCGCASRKKALNDATERLLTWFHAGR